MNDRIGYETINRYGEESALNVPVPTAIKDEAKMIFRRQKQREAMAKWRSKLSPEEMDTCRKRNRDSQQKHRKNMSKEQIALKREKDREYYHRRKQRTADTSEKREPACAPISSHMSTCWWQIDETCNFQDRKINIGGYPNDAFRCKRCGKYFWNRYDCLRHEFGLTGNYASKYVPQKVIVQPPCFRTGSSKTPPNKMRYLCLENRDKSVFVLLSKDEILDELNEMYRRDYRFYQGDDVLPTQDDAFKIQHCFRVIEYYNKKRLQAKYSDPGEDDRERKLRALYQKKMPVLFKYQRLSSAQGRKALR